MNVAIDTGNKSIKTVNNIFVAGVSEQATEPTMSAKTDWIRYEGAYYVLSGLRGGYLKDKSKDNRYFILALFGVVKELEQAEADGKLVYEKGKVNNISLLTGLPPAHMEDRDLKKRYQAYFRTGHPIQVFYNGRTWTIDIRSVRVYAQCFAALMSKPELLIRHERIFAIDIGGLTSDYMEFVNGRVSPEHTDSTENGVIPFYRMVQSHCRRRFDNLLDEEDIDAILLRSSSAYRPEVVEAVRKDSAAYADKFLLLFREMGLDLAKMFVVFMGGGAVLLWDSLKKSPLIGNCTLISDVKANAVGYDMIYRNMSKNTDAK